ncbi:hypothetical protein AUEXF2481DRAFT_77558 [Aureobasidium subglaciale EXF-2481]|uniref:Condensation domain-containing protein n=1 Tax=Aureobasidium subglaciale (strain EXF-2481) TaxID=1043005 RepID=A0A074YLU2_AURSE|nr:uncharacterized protein AUEXF2481DRAFT_77558 [Aureobasidium subglaciale EXF-2481]KEQ98630.1 hypothetical protein AUEXF2481DRAFT_77558 [Aureobasidium subglaciale EXF-2481]
MEFADSRSTHLRSAGNNEKRYIVRQSLGYYRTLAIGGIYTFAPASTSVISKQTFVPALKHCVATHPLLNATIEGQESESPAFPRPQTLDLHNHIELLSITDIGAGTKDASEKDPIHHITVPARKTTEDLAKCASTLHDQSIGLLAYLSKFRLWMQGEAEKDRDSSYEVRNLGVFDPMATSQKDAWTIESIFFAQPANLTGSCLAFNVVTKKGGDTIVSVTWQKGTLEVENEQALVNSVCELIHSYIGEAA